MGNLNFIVKVSMKDSKNGVSCRHAWYRITPVILRFFAVDDVVYRFLPFSVLLRHV